MSALQVPLEQLNDILPGPTPPVPLWYFWGPGLCLLLLLVIWLIHRFYVQKWKIYQQFKRQFNELQACSDDLFMQQLNAFLKDITRTYHDHTELAAMHNAEWLRFLDSFANADFQQFTEHWERWSYARQALSTEERAQVLQQCRCVLLAIRFRRPL